MSNHIFSSNNKHNNIKSKQNLKYVKQNSESKKLIDKIKSKFSKYAKIDKVAKIAAYTSLGYVTLSVAHLGSKIIGTEYNKNKLYKFKNKLVKLSKYQSLLNTLFEKKYQLQERIGCGSFGEAFRGLDVISGKKVVIKRVKIINDFKRDYLYKMEIENLKKIKKIRCQNVAEVLEIKHSDDDFINMVFKTNIVNGLILFDFMKIKSSIDIKVNIFKKALEGLVCLHKNGIVHGDIKPENMLVDSLGNMEYIDFGNSCIYKILRNCNVVYGTPLYGEPKIFDALKVENYKLLQETYSRYNNIRKNDIYSLAMSFILFFVEFIKLNDSQERFYDIFMDISSNNNITIDRFFMWKKKLPMLYKKINNKILKLLLMMLSNPSINIESYKNQFDKISQGDINLYYKEDILQISDAYKFK